MFITTSYISVLSRHSHHRCSMHFFSTSLRFLSPGNNLPTYFGRDVLCYRHFFSILNRRIKFFGVLTREKDLNLKTVLL